MNNDSIVFVGLDVHKESIVAAYSVGLGEVQSLGSIGVRDCGKADWRDAHRRWLSEFVFPQAWSQLAFEEHRRSPVMCATRDGVRRRISKETPTRVPRPRQAHGRNPVLRYPTREYQLEQPLIVLAAPPSADSEMTTR